MSQPTKRNCNVDRPGKTDDELNEFWVGNPFEIFMSENLSSFERNRLFLNTGRGNFIDVSFPAGVDTDSDGRSSVPTDFNNDGTLDLILRQAGGGPLQLLRNDFPPGRFLKVTLRGTDSNRLGIGSRITATAGQLQQTREVFPVNTYRSQRSLVAHFGLAEQEVVDTLVVRWPSGTEQQFDQIPAGQHIVITEGDPQWEPARRSAAEGAPATAAAINE